MEDVFKFMLVMATILGSVSGFVVIGVWAKRVLMKPTGASLNELRAVQATLAQLQTSIDSVAVEVERISEGQRFTTKLLADKSTLER